MTTDKQVVDSLTTQGKTTSQEEVPPQTIIGTFDTIESVRDAAVKARARVGFGLGNDILRRYGVKIADLPKDKWQKAGEWFNSLAVPIIRPCEAPCATFNEVLNYGHAPNAYARFAEECKDIQFKSASDLQIIPPAVDGGAEGIIRPGKGGNPGQFEPFTVSMSDLDIDPVADVIRRQFIAAEQRRQAVQAEAMVNLAVGVVAAKMSTHGFKFTRDANGKPDKFRIAVSPQELLDFQRLYTVTQEIQSDGGFIISIAPK